MNFERITDAVEVLSNKGQFDILLGYLDMPIPSNGLLTMPREVETPIKVNIDDIPSFSHDRLYAFTLNGPGSNTERVGWSWEDNGTVPVMTQPLSSLTLKAISNVSDNGKTLIVKGIKSDGTSAQETLTLNNAVPPVTTNAYVSITNVWKETTLNPVDLKTSTNVLLSTYATDENEPVYRQIRLSKTGVTVHILIRKRRFPIQSMDDFVPIQSKMALLIMIKALEAWRRNEFQLAQTLETQAVALAVDHQKSYNSFIEAASQTEVTTAQNLNYNNKDSVIVADIYDEAADILGPIGQEGIFDKITEALELLENKGLWEGMEGMVDICTDNFCYVTLPRYVDVPIQINICGQPTEFRNKWCNFHLNGSGDTPRCGWQDMGDVVTFRDVNYSQQLVAVPDLTSDINKNVRVYGYYKGKRIFTNEAGVDVDGFPVPMNNTTKLPVPGAQFVDRIERIVKDETNGFVSLIGYDASRNISVPIGYYWPDETEPNYRRIKLSQQAVWVRLRYRRRTRKVTSLTDPIHLRSRLAVLTMLRSIEALGQPNGLALAEQLEKKAVQLLADEDLARNPNRTHSLQFPDTMMADRDYGNIT